jgi:hypothetical protein
MRGKRENEQGCETVDCMQLAAAVGGASLLAALEVLR